VRVAPSHQAEASQIAAELAAIARTGMVLPGSITQRRTRCGRANCGCHADPPRLHGPYWQWTRKVAAKTICRWLSPDQHRDYQAWVGNDRRLHELLARLEALGAAALDADPRWKRQPAARTGRARQPPEPEHKPPDNVGSARLTCGHPLSRTPSAQVSPKREDLTRIDLGLYDSRSFLCARFVPMFAPCLLARTGPAIRCLSKTARPAPDPGHAPRHRDHWRPADVAPPSLDHWSRPLR